MNGFSGLFTGDARLMIDIYRDIWPSYTFNEIDFYSTKYVRYDLERLRTRTRTSFGGIMDVTVESLLARVYVSRVSMILGCGG